MSEHSPLNNPEGRDPDDSRTPTPPLAWNEGNSVTLRHGYHSARSAVHRNDSVERRHAKNTLAETIKAGKLAGGVCSICVLDTNTIVSAYDFLSLLFERLLQFAMQAYLTPTENAPPFILVLPRFVLDELDHLKKRQGVSHKARAAGHWLESALRKQKKSRTIKGGIIEAKLPEERWPLHAQDWDSAKEMGGRLERGMSMDEAIVQFCKRLQKDTRMPLMFCSNDTNARTRAEVEKVSTFDLESVLRVVDDIRKSTDSKSSEAVDGPGLLLDQWTIQLEIQEGTVLTDAASQRVTSGQDAEDPMELDDDDAVLSESFTGSALPPSYTAPKIPASSQPHVSGLSTSSSHDYHTGPRHEGIAIPQASSTRSPNSHHKAIHAVKNSSEDILTDSQVRSKRKAETSSTKASSSTVAKRGTSASIHAPPSASAASSSSSRSSVRANPYSRPAPRPGSVTTQEPGRGESRKAPSSGPSRNLTIVEPTSTSRHITSASPSGSADIVTNVRNSNGRTTRIGGMKRDRSTMSSAWAPTAPIPSTSTLLDSAKRSAASSRSECRH